jgi:hypothetical protein
MQLVVENGQGLNNANSYIDTADVENYLPSTVLAKFNKLSEDEQIDCAVTASLFVDYSFNWKGRQKTLEQGLNWPRINVFFQGHDVPDDFIPLQVKKASATAISLIIKFGIGVFQKTGEAQVKKEKLGFIETEYFETLKKANLYNSEYSDINNMLRGLFYEPQNGVITAEVLRK